jgi:glutaconate CoA-transferase, subunit B
VTQHEPRRFVEKADFITSPGYLSGGDTRTRAGLAAGRLGAVVTDLALLDFESASRRMRLRAVQSGVGVADVRKQTGFDLLVAPVIDELPPPSAQELAIYRQVRDGPRDGPRAARADEPDSGDSASAGNRAPAKAAG